MAVIGKAQAGVVHEYPAAVEDVEFGGLTDSEAVLVAGLQLREVGIGVAQPVNALADARRDGGRAAPDRVALAVADLEIQPRTPVKFHVGHGGVEQ